MAAAVVANGNVASWLLTRVCCIAGLGIALLPLFLIAGELQRGQLVPAPGGPMQSRSAYYLVVPDEKRLYPPVASFRSWLLAKLPQTD